VHGGKIPRGVASPHFVHGRHSRDLPAHLAERYADLLGDAERDGLRSEIALVCAAIIDRLERLPEAVETEAEKREDAPLARSGGSVPDQGAAGGRPDTARAAGGAGADGRARSGAGGGAGGLGAPRRHVADPRALAAISRDVEEILEGIDGTGHHAAGTPPESRA
jgi:hypothetical protein